ncbi:MAG: lamin tail domain-containing protein [Sulfurovum sp.]|nr:lamin tail domain-containing protein [Sulfurovum sp.]
MKRLLFLLPYVLLTTNLHAWKMEADKIQVDNTNGNTVTYINFRQIYDIVPLVFVLMDDRGGDPSTLRVANITTTGFDVYTVEPDGEDGPHTNMNSIPYIAIESGTHTLPDGTQIVAGSISTQRFQSMFISGDSWQAVGLSGFSTTPIVLGQIQTRINERTDATVPDAVSQPWITTAVSNVTSSGFNVALERSETTSGTLTSAETIAYLAMDSGLNSGNHYFASNDSKKIEYETIRTNDTIQGWDNPDTTVNFSTTYSDPIVVATKNTRDGIDGGWLRRGTVAGSHITLQVDEDRANDTERGHTTERAGIVLFSRPFDAEFLPTSNARMLINEVMYNETQTGTNNDEFVELYVTQAGDIEGYVLSDQDTNYYRFPSCSVSSGDYVIFHTGSGVNSCSGTVKHFYQGVSQYWNNSKDDVLLLRTAIDDVTTTTQASSPKTFNAKPQDYVAYGTLGGAVDAIPISMKGVTVSWNYSYGTELDNASDGVSVALTPNAKDSNTSACWELSTSGNAANNSCGNYIPTRSTATAPLSYTLGESNTAMPDMSIVKSSVVLNDPVNNTTNPKRIPGATIRYCFTVDNTGDGNAENAVINDTLTGSGRDNLTYVNAGFVLQNINTTCSCSTIADTSGSISGTNVTITIGDISGTGNVATSRACAYIEMSIN